MEALINILIWCAISYALAVVFGLWFIIPAVVLIVIPLLVALCE